MAANQTLSELLPRRPMKAAKLVGQPADATTLCRKPHLRLSQFVHMLSNTKDATKHS